MACSKFCLEKTNFQLHSERKEAGDWILCHSQSAVIQQFFLALAFYFLSFALKDFKGLIQRLWRCIKTQGPDRILPVSPIKQNSDMAKFLGLLGFNREEHALVWREARGNEGLGYRKARLVEPCTLPFPSPTKESRSPSLSPSVSLTHSQDLFTRTD